MRNEEINSVGTVHIVGGVKHTKTNKTQVKKEIEKNGKWHGLLVPNKVNSFHWHGGWNLGHVETFTSVEEFETHINSMVWYMEKELGNGVALYTMKEGK